MRHRRAIATTLTALGLALVGVGSVAAKGGDAIATLDEPLPPGPVAGSTIAIGWSLDLRQDDGTTLPFYAQNVFLRFTPPTGKPIDVAGLQDRQGHFTATVTVPAGGLGEIAFGMQGEACSAGGTCVASPEFFRVSDTTAAAAAAAAAAARTQAGRAPAPGQRREAAVGPAAVAPVAAGVPGTDPAAHPVTSTPAPTPRTAPSVDVVWLAAVLVIGLALTGTVVTARGRGRTSAA